MFIGELKAVHCGLGLSYDTTVRVYIDSSQLPTLDSLIVKGTWIVKI